MDGRCGPQIGIIGAPSGNMTPGNPSSSNAAGPSDARSSGEMPTLDYMGPAANDFNSPRRRPVPAPQQKYIVGQPMYHPIENRVYADGTGPNGISHGYKYNNPREKRSQKKTKSQFSIDGLLSPKKNPIEVITIDEDDAFQSQTLTGVGTLPPVQYDLLQPFYNNTTSYSAPIEPDIIPLELPEDFLEPPKEDPPVETSEAPQQQMDEEMAEEDLHTNQDVAKPSAPVAVQERGRGLIRTNPVGQIAQASSSSSASHYSLAEQPMQPLQSTGYQTPPRSASGVRMTAAPSQIQQHGATQQVRHHNGSYQPVGRVQNPPNPENRAMAQNPLSRGRLYGSVGSSMSRHLSAPSGARGQGYPPQPVQRVVSSPATGSNTILLTPQSAMAAQQLLRQAQQQQHARPQVVVAQQVRHPNQLIQRQIRHVVPLPPTRRQSTASLQNAANARGLANSMSQAALAMHLARSQTMASQHQIRRPTSSVPAIGRVPICSTPQQIRHVVVTPPTGLAPVVAQQYIQAASNGRFMSNAQQQAPQSYAGQQATMSTPIGQSSAPPQQVDESPPSAAPSLIPPSELSSSSKRNLSLAHRADQDAIIEVVPLPSKPNSFKKRSNTTSRGPAKGRSAPAPKGTAQNANSTQETSTASALAPLEQPPPQPPAKKRATAAPRARGQKQAAPAPIFTQDMDGPPPLPVKPPARKRSRPAARARGNAAALPAEVAPSTEVPAVVSELAKEVCQTFPVSLPVAQTSTSSASSFAQEPSDSQVPMAIDRQKMQQLQAQRRLELARQAEKEAVESRSAGQSTSEQSVELVEPVEPVVQDQTVERPPLKKQESELSEFEGDKNLYDVVRDHLSAQKQAEQRQGQSTSSAAPIDDPETGMESSITSADEDEQAGAASLASLANVIRGVVQADNQQACQQVVAPAKPAVREPEIITLSDDSREPSEAPEAPAEAEEEPLPPCVLDVIDAVSQDVQKRAAERVAQEQSTGVVEEEAAPIASKAKKSPKPRAPRARAPRARPSRAKGAKKNAPNRKKNTSDLQSNKDGRPVSASIANAIRQSNPDWNTEVASRKTDSSGETIESTSSGGSAPDSRNSPNGEGEAVLVAEGTSPAKEIPVAAEEVAAAAEGAPAAVEETPAKSNRRSHKAANRPPPREATRRSVRIKDNFVKQQEEIIQSLKPAEKEARKEPAAKKQKSEEEKEKEKKEPKARKRPAPKKKTPAAKRKRGKKKESSEEESASEEGSEVEEVIIPTPSKTRKTAGGKTPAAPKKRKFYSRVDYNRHFYETLSSDLLLKVLTPVHRDKFEISDHFAYPVIRRAMVNRHTLCYAISMLQVMMRVPQIYYIIRSHEHPNVIDKDGCFLCKLQYTITHKPCYEEYPLFIGIMREVWSGVQVDQMHCVMEAMQHFLDRFDEDYLREHPIHETGRNPTIRSFFEILIINDYKCLMCGHIFPVTDKAVYLSIDLTRKNPNKTPTMQSLINNFSKPMPAHGFECAFCEGDRFTCTTRFTKLPEVLLYFIPRVRSRRNEKDMTVVEVQRTVVVAENDVDQKYSLCAFVTHHGESGRNGHYKTFEVDHHLPDEPYNEFDDARVNLDAMLTWDMTVVVAMFRREAAVAKDAATDIIFDGRGNVSYANEKYVAEATADYRR